jgi:uncharacterized protein (TIGR02594 family)
MKDLLQKALSQWGVTEVDGELNNPQIMTYSRETDMKWIQDDEAAWCSIFMNWVAKSCGYEYTKEQLARSWLKVGRKVENPSTGNVVIFWRKEKDSKWGHVGIYVTEDEDYIYVLGGNQDNSVNIKPYPKDGNYYGLLGYRKLNRII